MSKLNEAMSKLAGKAPAAADGGEGGDANEAGRALIAALKANDPAAVEEAIRACVDGYND